MALRFALHLSQVLLKEDHPHVGVHALLSRNEFVGTETQTFPPGRETHKPRKFGISRALSWPLEASSTASALGGKRTLP
jgi:hypothetical protein